MRPQAGMLDGDAAVGRRGCRWLRLVDDTTVYNSQRREDVADSGQKRHDMPGVAWDPRSRSVGRGGRVLDR